eukprot:gene11500-biopygen196
MMHCLRGLGRRSRYPSGAAGYPSRYRRRERAEAFRLGGRRQGLALSPIAIPLLSERGDQRLTPRRASSLPSSALRFAGVARTGNLLIHVGDCSLPGRDGSA